MFFFIRQSCICLNFRKVASLIRKYSEPNKSQWQKLRGKTRKICNSFAEAEKYIERKESSDESDRIADVVSKAKRLDNSFGELGKIFDLMHVSTFVILFANMCIYHGVKSRYKSDKSMNDCEMSLYFQ